MESLLKIYDELKHIKEIKNISKKYIGDIKVDDKTYGIHIKLIDKETRREFKTYLYMSNGLVFDLKEEIEVPYLVFLENIKNSVLGVNGLLCLIKKERNEIKYKYLKEFQNENKNIYNYFQKKKKEKLIFFNKYIDVENENGFIENKILDEKNTRLFDGYGQQIRNQDTYYINNENIDLVSTIDLLMNFRKYEMSEYNELANEIYKEFKNPITDVEIKRELAYNNRLQSYTDVVVITKKDKNVIMQLVSSTNVIKRIFVINEKTGYSIHENEGLAYAIRFDPEKDGTNSLVVSKIYNLEKELFDDTVIRFVGFNFKNVSNSKFINDIMLKASENIIEQTEKLGISVEELFKEKKEERSSFLDLYSGVGRKNAKLGLEKSSFEKTYIKYFGNYNPEEKKLVKKLKINSEQLNFFNTNWSKKFFNSGMIRFLKNVFVATRTEINTRSEIKEGLESINIEKIKKAIISISKVVSNQRKFAHHYRNKRDYSYDEIKNAEYELYEKVSLVFGKIRILMSEEKMLNIMTKILNGHKILGFFEPNIKTIKTFNERQTMFQDLLEMKYKVKSSYDKTENNTPKKRQLREILASVDIVHKEEKWLKNHHDLITFITNKENFASTIKNTFSYDIESRLRRFEFENETYKIVAPKSEFDLRVEGAQNSNCVGGYYDRVKSGNTMVLLVRRKEAIEIPFYTIELTNQLNMTQLYTKYNKQNYTKDFIEFIKKWMKEKNIKTSIELK